MEEVDQIVLHTLRQIGCDFEDVTSLKQFNTDAAMEGVVRCLNVINPSLELSHNIPPSMSGKYRLGAALATSCIDLGYKGEIGYQTFLYSNESDLRKIFLFLFENLPKESEKNLEEPLNKNAMILKEISSSLTCCLNMPWLPIYCRNNASNSHNFLMKNQLFGNNVFLPITLFTPKYGDKITSNNSYKLYCKNDLKLVSKQADIGSQLNASILISNSLSYITQSMHEWNEDDLTSLNKKELLIQKKGRRDNIINNFLIQALEHTKEMGTPDILLKSVNPETRGSRFAHALELQFTPDRKENISVMAEDEISKPDSEEEKQRKREIEIKELQEEIDNLTEKFESMSKENKKYEIACLKIKELILKEESTIEEIKERYRVKKCTLSLLPDAETNIEKLQSFIDSSTQRLKSLAVQWENHRVPLVNELNELKQVSSQRVDETQRKLEEIKSIREKIQNLGVEARQKEDMHKHLITAYEKLTKDVSRSAYTRRILEIVGNIKKQKAEIDKVLLDTRSVQKEINKLSGKLERTFTVTDELIFRDAKKDEAIRRAYKFLAALHDNCSQLVQIVEETGAIVREIRELEDQIDQENQKQISATLQRITSDYKQMQKENASLMEQLK